MEPNRYWLLYIGILLVFISSQTGQTICWRVFNLVRAFFYMTLALIAAGAARLLWALGNLLLRYSNRRKAERERSCEPNR